MSYLEKRVVLYPYSQSTNQQFYKNLFHVILPLFALNRIKIHSENNLVHIKRGSYERELVVLPFFKEQYEKILREDNIGWKDPYIAFIQDLAIDMERTDKVYWILATPEDLQILQLQLMYITADFCLYQKESDHICRMTNVDFFTEMVA